MPKPQILIVEDEVLIADMIQRYLVRMDYEVIGVALSYEEAIHFLQEKKIDLVLLDIRLNSSKTGIDVAVYIQQNLNVPHIFLTSQLDSTTLESAKKTLPAGYLSKPIQKESLYATIEITLHNAQHQKMEKEPSFITINSNNENHKIYLDDILYIQVEHIYSTVFLNNSSLSLLTRTSLKEFLGILPSHQFIQPHRSFIINTKHISSWDKNNINIGKTSISISRSNKELILSTLQKL